MEAPELPLPSTSLLPGPFLLPSVAQTIGTASGAPSLASLVAVGCQCEADAQRRFASISTGAVSANFGVLQAGWYGPSSENEDGWFALCAEGSALEAYIGRVLRVQLGQVHTYVALVGSAPLSFELALARRAFASLAPLSRASL
ncbi:MAG: hypothetical protein KGL39_38645, partial [Patescibacteria group bacterium]|nr:hypothetical protein [Patescibacteria group bacterium]